VARLPAQAADWARSFAFMGSRDALHRRPLRSGVLVFLVATSRGRSERKERVRKAHDDAASELPPLLGTATSRVLIGRREIGFSEVSPALSETDGTLEAENGKKGARIRDRRRGARLSQFDWSSRTGARKIVQGPQRPACRFTIQQSMPPVATGIVNLETRSCVGVPLWFGAGVNAVANEVADRGGSLESDGSFAHGNRTKR